MPYIGNDLATQFQAFATQTITGDGSTGYTLDRAVANGKELLVYINNVKQEEGSGKSYEASGTTITFSAAVASTDSCYLVYMGSAQQTVTAPDGSIVSANIANASLELPSTLDMNGNELILDADADTSITADTDDRIDIKVAGSDVVHVDSGGRVGIGTNSPSGYDDEADNFVIYEAGSSGHAGITIANDGNDARGHILFADGTSGSAAYQGAVSYDHSDNKMFFRTAATERMRIDSSGNVLIGKTAAGTAAGVQLEPTGTANIARSGDLCLVLDRLTNAGEIVSIRQGNTAVGGIDANSSSTDFNTSSDYRLKENVTTSWDATTRLKQLKPVRFSWKIDSKSEADTDGFLAHEVSSVVPQAISGEKDAVDADGNPKHQGIDHSKLVALLVKTVQELEARIATLESK